MPKFKLWRELLLKEDLPRNKTAKIDTVNVHVGIILFSAFSFPQKDKKNDHV